MLAVAKPAVLSVQEFDYFRSRIFDLAGISLSEAKRDLIQSRLRPRLVATGMEDFLEYRKYLESLPPSHEEWEAFTNLLTTNKTDWFREKEHFNYIVSDFLPKWKTLGKKHLQVWCAASSTGEEPYTLSLVLNEALKGSGITYEIQASDIDTKVLRQAVNGVYPKDRLSFIPDKYHSNFALGSGEIAGWMKVRKEIRGAVQYSQFNLTHLPYRWAKPFDLILCRNVLIYFNAETIRQVVDGFFGTATKDSVLIIAHSESLQNIKSNWKYIRPSIYSKGRVF